MGVDFSVAAERAEFFFVDFLEERALVEFRGRFEVAYDLALGRIERFDLDRRAGVALLAQVVQTTPGAFHALEFRGMHHLAQLRR